MVGDDRLGWWEAVFCAGCLLAGSGALSGSRVVASIGCALVIVAGCVCGAIVERGERLSRSLSGGGVRPMREPTSRVLESGHTARRPS